VTVKLGASDGINVQILSGITKDSEVKVGTHLIKTKKN
jgi:HlyD family secretion protein